MIFYGVFKCGFYVEKLFIDGVGIVVIECDYLCLGFVVLNDFEGVCFDFVDDGVCNGWCWFVVKV